jgi:hypothetical protein
VRIGKNEAISFSGHRGEWLEQLAIGDTVVGAVWGGAKTIVRVYPKP